MKKGDIVIIDDGSWSRTVIDGKLIQEKTGYYRNKQYVVVETGCMFPNTGSRGSTLNNTVIQALDSGKVVFIEERFLSLVKPKHRIMVDMVQTPNRCFIAGDIVEISDNLYQEILRQR